MTHLMPENLRGVAEEKAPTNLTVSHGHQNVRSSLFPGLFSLTSKILRLVSAKFCSTQWADPADLDQTHQTSKNL
jgi:hypothetical protein